MDEREFQAALLADAARLRLHISRRIPRYYRAVISPDEVLQEVWVSAFRRRDSFVATSVDAIQRWTTCIANRKLIDALRAVTRVKRGGGRTNRRQSVGADETFAALFAHLATTRRTPSRELKGREARAVFRAALQDMPPIRRQVVHLRYVEGRGIEEIARETGRTPRAINNLLSRALDDLRRVLGSIEPFFSDRGSVLLSFGDGGSADPLGKPKGSKPS